MMFGFLGGCGRGNAVGTSGAPVYQPESDPDPERGAENQVRQLLAQVNARELEIAGEARSAAAKAADGLPGQAREAREQFYSADAYLEALRAAETAITNKMAALDMQRAILANSMDANITEAWNIASGQTNRASVDEHAEETELKARLMQLQSLNDDLFITSPPSGQLDPKLEEKAAAARDDLYSAQEYVSRLNSTVAQLKLKLKGLEAEAAIYEGVLTSGTAHSTGNAP
jgi:hypothetical protein